MVSDKDYLAVWGDDTNLGTILSVEKTKAFVGVSVLSGGGRRGRYQVRYCAYFFNPSMKPIGQLSSWVQYTTVVTTKTVTKMRKYLRGKGYLQDVGFRIDMCKPLS